MSHLAVTVAVLFLACVYAAPAPEPDNPKFAFAKDSALGLGVANGENSKAHGAVVGNNAVGTPVEAPIDTGNNVPDVTVFDKVDAGAAFAAAGGVASGVVKNNNFENDPTKGAGFPFFG